MLKKLINNIRSILGIMQINESTITTAYCEKHHNLQEK